MPGSKANRTKGNAKPSSSSRAAQLLSQPGSATVGFIGFEGFGGAHAYVPANQAFDDVDSCLDSEFRLILRKLTKRDAKTKIKSLGEFSALCKEKDDATLQAVLPFWPRLYNKLAIDVDAKVRECTQTAMTNLVGRVRRNLAPYLKNVMGAWILSQNDTYPTVATAAKKSFSTAFPPEKQESAISFCRQAVLEYITDNLLNQTAATLSDPKTTEKEEMESKFQRVLSSSLMGLRQLLLALPTAQIDDSFKGKLRSLLNDGKFWNYSKSQVALVRIALYWFLGSLCKTTPDVAGEYVRKLSPLILGSIDCIDPSLTQAVWDAVLCLVKFVPACWDNINWQKAFWPKLRKVLENGCEGNAAIVAPNVLPLLGCIPLEAAGGGSIFFPKVLELFRNGFSKDCVANSLSETNSWTRAFLECVQFSIRQISSEESSSPILHSIFIDQLLPVIEASLFDPKPILSRSQLYSSVSVLLRTTAGSPKTSKVVAAMWCSLCEDLGEMFETIGFEKEQSLHPERLVAFIKTVLCPQDTSGHAGAKTERVKFATEVKRPCASDSVPADVFVSEEMKTLMKEVIIRSHRQYRRSRHSVHLKLFVDLCNVYFPAEIAVCVLHSIEAEKDIESGETTIENQDSCVDPHSKIIDIVVLPALAGKEGAERNDEVVDHTITLLFACLPYLSQESSTRVWDNVLEMASSTGALCSLVTRALEKRRVMTQVTQWLSSTCLHSQLCQLVLRVTKNHSAIETEELEQGWKLICLVLSANDDNEPVFPSSWIVEIVSRVHQELVSLTTHTLDRQNAEQVQTLIHFVARAALIFFKNLKMSLNMREGCDVILALMMADLDTQFAASGDADSVLRQSWTTGLGLIIQQTGGLIKDGGVLASACHIILDTLLTRALTMEQYRLLVEVTETFLNTMQNHLPMGDDSEDEINGMVNPVLVALMSELIVSPCIPQNDIVKVIDYHCLTGQLPLTVRGKNCVQRTENTTDMAAAVFSSLFNLHLVRCFHSGFKFDKQPEFGEQSVWDGGEETVIVEAVRSLFVVTTWLKLESQVPPEVVGAVEELTKMAHTCFFSSSISMQQKILTTAFSRIKDDVLMALTFIHLAQLQSTHQKKIDKDFFQNLYNSEKPQNREFLETEAVAGYIPLWQVSSVFEIQTVLLNSIGDNTSLAAAASHVRILSLLLNAEPEHMLETYGEMIEAVLTKLKAIRDDDSTLFLFSCDVGEEHVNKMAFNVSVMQLLSVIVNCGDFYKLSSDHWDFILCSTVSWVESLGSSSMNFSSSLKVQTFCVEICRLVTALSYTVQHRISENEDVYLPNLKTEWTEFFGEGIYSQLFPLCVTLLEELKETKSKGDVAVIVSALGSAMFHCPQQQITNHQLPLKLAASDDTSPIPESLQTVLNYLCPVLTCPVAPAQVTAFVILNKIVNLLPSYHSKEENDRSSTASASSESVMEEIMSRSPPAVLMKVIEDGSLAMDIVLDAVAMESNITLMPDSEEYQFALGYLLAWQLLLDFFHSADSTEQMKYTAYLKEHSCVSQLLTHLFRLMPSSPGSGSPPVRQMMEGSPSKSSLSVDNSSTPAKSHKHPTAETGRDDTWFSSSGINLTPYDVGQPNDIQRVSCSVYLHCLNVMPVLVRQWWKDQDRKSAAYVDKFTTKYVSPHLIKTKMRSISSSDLAIEELKVTTSSLTRAVTACYTMEELKTEFQITLPENYPLGEISVSADRNAVGKWTNWDRMLLQISVFLQHQSGNIMEGVRLWKKNIDKKLEGVEECYICYAVIHATTMDTPRLPCKTCKKKFHNACLSEWLNSSQNATCPLCRSPFFG